jgi:hypothetical protein
MMRRALVLAGVMVVCAPALSLAHLMPEGNGSTRLVGNKAYTLVSIPVGVLTGFDDDGNNLISDAEARAHYASLQAQIEKLGWLSSGGVRGATLYSDLQVPHFDCATTISSTAVIQIRVSGWDSAVTSLALHADLFTKKDKELAYRVVRGDSTERAVLTARRPEAGFFGARVAEPTPPPSLLAPALLLVALLGLYCLVALSRRKSSPSLRISAP